MNKIVAVSSLFFVVISFVTASVQAADAKKPHQKPDFLQTVDTNKDGKASKAEFIAAMDRKFNSMDVDKNDTVSVQELKIYGEKDEEARRRALQIAEQGGDFENIISKGRFLQLFTERALREFAMLDTNHDNVLSADEVGVGKSKRKKNTKNQKAKTMSKDEFVGIFIENATRDFLRLDKNRDGKLTESELGVKPKIQHPPRLEEPVALPKLPKLSTLLPSPHKPHTTDKKAQQHNKLIKSFFVGIDANHDGKISNKEKNAVFESLFKRLDTNHDQFITQDEIIAGRHTPLSAKH